MLAAVCDLAGVGGGGDASRKAPDTLAWDFSAFHSAADAAVKVVEPPPPAPPTKAEERRRVVQAALMQAHESQAAMLSEKARRQNMSTKQRGRLSQFLSAGEGYKDRSETKAGRKAQARKRLNKVRNER